MTIRILLADDHGITREGLKALLEQKEDLEVVAQAEDGRMAVKLARQHRPDVVIMDIRMPALNGADATRKIRAELPDTRVIGLSMYSDMCCVSGMLKAGADGYLVKNCIFDELVAAVYAVVQGRLYVSRNISDLVLKDYVHRVTREDQDRETRPLLSIREKEVLQLIAEGHKTGLIAEKIHISVKTVETHRKNIMGKLNLFSVAELTKYAVREGITSLEP